MLFAVSHSKQNQNIFISEETDATSCEVLRFYHWLPKECQRFTRPGFKWTKVNSLENARYN